MKYSNGNLSGKQLPAIKLKLQFKKPKVNNLSKTR